MTKTARERLAELLGGSAPTGSFSAQLSAPADLLRLVVSGVGPVRLLLRAPLAKKLIAVARPAKFGRGEETLADVGVRDTWELTPGAAHARDKAAADLAWLTATRRTA